MKGCLRCKGRYFGSPSRCPIDGGELAELPDPLVGRVIGGLYRVSELLGEGGMGSVYRARAELRNEDVALKFLAREYSADPAQKERFLREARAVNRIRHENIIDILDFGETEDGWVYLVMELLTGEPLSRLIAQGPVPGFRTFFIVEQVCRALIRAHELEVIHRDLKSENIFLEQREGRADFVKVLDFGLARMSQELRLTKSGAVIGTPEYMSPEQARGEPCGPASDLYSLGVLTYELLTGRLPFEGLAAQLLVKHIRDEPPPPSRFQTDVTPLVERVVLRMLAKQPSARHRDANHLLEDVLAVREEASATALPLVQQTRERARTRRVDLFESPEPPAAWALRTAIFQRMVSRAYVDRPTPAWLAEALGKLDELCGESMRLNTEIAELAAAVEAEERRVREIQVRLGRALDELTCDESRVVRELEDLDAKLERLAGRVEDALGDFERARGALFEREGGPKSALCTELAAAYELAGRRAAGWRVAEQELEQVQGSRRAKERESEDLRFQVAQLKGRLGSVGAELEAGLKCTRSRIAERGQRCDQITQALGELGARLSAHLAGFPELRERLFAELAETSLRKSGAAQREDVGG